MATEEQLNKLISQWKADPCWDLEDSEGFEEHYEYLRNTRLNIEYQWNAERLAQLDDKARAIGVPGNRTLAEYVNSLEQRIVALENKLDEHGVY